MEEQVLNPEQEAPAAPTDVEVVDIQFRPGQKVYFFDPNGARYNPGDHVIIDTARGAEYGICTGGNHKIPPKDVVAPLRKVLRRANAQDERIAEENRRSVSFLWATSSSVCFIMAQIYSAPSFRTSGEARFSLHRPPPMDSETGTDASSGMLSISCWIMRWASSVRGIRWPQPNAC